MFTHSCHTNLFSQGTPVLAEFNTEEFIQSLDSSLITCEVKGDWSGLVSASYIGQCWLYRSVLII